MSEVVTLWMDKGSACYFVEDSFVPADQLTGATRLYAVSEGGDEMFYGSLGQFEDAFGGVQGQEEVLFAACAEKGWTLRVVDERIAP